MIRSRTLSAVMAATLVASLAWPPMALAAGPATTPATILSEGFESAGSANYSTTLVGGNAYWGRSTGRARTGSYGLWNAGSRSGGLPSAWPQYPEGTEGTADFPLSILADYYSSSASYYYTQPSLGSGEYLVTAKGLNVLYAPMTGTGTLEGKFPLTAAGAWSLRTRDTGLSRQSGTLQFQFYDDSTDGSVGEGPSIDDVTVSAWKYGPVRSLAGSVTTSAVNLSWLRPWRSQAASAVEERAVAYRLYRAPGGTTAWTELTGTRLGDTAVSTSTAIPGEGQSYRYSVQTWDPGTGAGYGLSAETTVAIPAVPPAVGMTAPAAGFALSSAPVLIAGTSSDTGTGVSQVAVRIRRAGGLCWNGAGWVSADTWVPATTSNSWSAWSYSWSPDLAVLAAGEIVTVSARATDGAALSATSAGVSSATPMNASVALAGGAPTTTQTSVVAAVSASGATDMRWSVDGGATFNAWQPFSASPTVSLSSGDGTKTVVFEFSTNGGTTTAGVASDTITLHTSVPATSITAPSAGFSLLSGKVNITGTASDTGGSVSAVEVRARRGDGLSWNGSAWVVGDTWLPATTANAYASWTASFTPDAALLASGQTVTLNARATDAVGLTGTSAGVTSGVPVQASVSLAAGATYTTSLSVPVSIATTGTPTHMRWKVDAGAFGSWVAFTSTTNVTLPAGDGAKTVTFEFSADGGSTVAATASDAITLHTSIPVAAITAPAAGFSLTNGKVNISGTASDSGGSVSSVEVRVRRGDGLSWTGASWTATDTWLPASTSNGYASWAASFTPDAGLLVSGNIVTLSARATDMVGLVGTSAGVASNAPVQASISLADGAAFTTSLDVPVSIATTGTPTHMRWKVDSGSFGSWTPFAATATAALPAGDGSKTVTFEFSADGGSTVSATASDTIVLHTSLPSLTVSTPTTGFPLNAGPVLVSGSAADVGGSVTGVEVRVRRSDGACWNGVGWTATDTWLAASTANGFANWTYTFAPGAPAIVAGKLVTVSTRATDGFGLAGFGADVSSGVPIDAAISVAGGAPYSVVTSVPVAISSVGATHMRWRVGAGAWSSWSAAAASADIALSSGDGTKTVTFEFSADGGSTVGATATDTIMLHTSVPSVGISTPASEFALNSGPVLISGTAADVGGTVAGVEVRVRRSDGACWNGTAWTGVDTWLAASTSDGFATWSYSFAPAASAIVAGKLVTVSSRATDSFGLYATAPDVSSSVPVVAQISAAGGASYVATTTVPVAISSVGATHMRWRIDSGSWSSWLSYAPSLDVTLTPGDGAKTVTFEFSSNGGSTVGATASDVASLDLTAPSRTFTSPVAGFSPQQTLINVAGSAADTGAGVSAVRVRVSRGGLYWNGSQWQSSEVWLPASGTATWSYAWNDATAASNYLPATVAVVAEDAVGNVSTPATVTSLDPLDPTSFAIAASGSVINYGGSVTLYGTLASLGTPLASRYVYLQYWTGSAWVNLYPSKLTASNGAVSFTVKPDKKTSYRLKYYAGSGYNLAESAYRTVTPRVSLSTPSRPSSAVRNRAFTVIGTLKPRHTAGTYPVKVECYRYERQSNGSYKWVLRKTVSAKASNYYSYSRYTASVSLPYAGKWVLRAYAPTDTLHYATSSGYTSSFTAK